MSVDSDVLYTGRRAAAQHRWVASLMATREARQRDAEEWAQLMRVVIPALMIAIVMMLVVSGMPLISR